MLTNNQSKKCMNKIIDNLKAKGTFDQLRRECMANVDTKPSYRNLLQRVEGYVSKFFYKQKWSSSLNKNQLRNKLRNEINASDMLRNGIEHLVDQIVNEKIKKQFSDRIEEALNDYLGIVKEEEIKNDIDCQSSNVSVEDNRIENCEDKEEKTEIKFEETVLKSEKNVQNENPQTQNLSAFSQYNEDDNQSVDMDISSGLPSPENFCLNSNSGSVIENSNDASENKNLTELTSFKNISNNNLNSSEDLNNQVFSDEIDKSLKPAEIEDVLDNSENDKKSSHDEKDEISDVSSVHTSDLSDFDDEISIEGSDEELENKKKISLKVVKELAASITTESRDWEDEKSKQKLGADGEIMKNKITDSKNEQQNVIKRKRKVNPKFLSPEYSFNDKKPKLSSNEIHHDTDNIKPSLKKKTLFQNSESKVVKQNSIKQDFSQSKINEIKNNNSKFKKNLQKHRNDQSNKRYDTSDLYKPRYSLSSNRRGRSQTGPVTPDSNSNSNDDTS